MLVVVAAAQITETVALVEQEVEAQVVPLLAVLGQQELVVAVAEVIMLLLLVVQVMLVALA
jgi:hypothetical protein